MTSGIAQSRRRLPVWAVVKRSYGYVWDHRRLFALPMILVFFVQLLVAFYSIHATRGADPRHMGVALLPIYAATILSILFSATVIVGIHRTVLLDEVRSGIGFLRLDRNFLRYVGTWLLLLVVGILLFIILGLLAGLIGAAGILVGSPGAHAVIVLTVFASMVVLGGVFLRFMLALPAAALGDKDRLGVSWNATKGNWWRLFVVTFLTFMPFLILSIIASIPAMTTAVHNMQSVLQGGTPVQAKPSIAMVLFGAAIKAIDIGVLTVMLSLCYDVLVRGGGPALIEHSDPASI